jgi:phospholipase C
LTTFFGIYRPQSNAKIRNLLSQGIVNRDGNPGPEFTNAAQRRAEVRDTYQVTPQIVGTYGELPRPGTTYAPGLPRFAPDARFPALLANGPFQITRYVDYTAAVGDPVHRFFQMWQQVDGGRRDLFVWVDETSGEGSQNRADPDSGTNQGAVAMGFYNMAAGDAPYFRQLAENYALSDNHHQPVMGGTGANFQALATGHAIAYWRDGILAHPPPGQIENPNPRPGTNNWYTQSGYSNGSYTNCSDTNAPGSKSIRAYLTALPYRPFNDGNCEPDAYYLVNNYHAGFLANGEPAALGSEIFRVPPQSQPTIADALSAKGITWKWYSGGRAAGGVTSEEYCGVYDPLTYSSAIMTGPLKANLQGPCGAVPRYRRHLRDARRGLCDPAQYGIRPPRILDRITLRSVPSQADRQGPVQPGAVGEVGDPGDRRRGRRLLGQRLHPDPRRPRRRDPHSADRRLALRPEGRDRPHLHRPYLDPEIH